jgi:transposase
MGQKELLRSKVLEMVKQGGMTLKSAAVTLRISYRQGIRLYTVYLEKGDAGLIHGNYGKRSNNRTSELVLEKALQTYRLRYYDFGPTFAAEKLYENEGVKISVNVLRRLLIASGDWKGARRRKEYRSRRERKEHFGELIQFDGSHHKWFEGRGPSCCLITMIDDATSIRLSRFFEQETLEGGMPYFIIHKENTVMPPSSVSSSKNWERRVFVASSIMVMRQQDGPRFSNHL